MDNGPAPEPPPVTVDAEHLRKLARRYLKYCESLTLFIAAVSLLAFIGVAIGHGIGR